MANNGVMEAHERAEEGRYQRSLDERERAKHYTKRAQFMEVIEKELRNLLQKFEAAESEGLIESETAKEIRSLIEQAYGKI